MSSEEITVNDFTWLAQVFQKEGEDCQRKHRDETLPKSRRHQMFGQAQFAFAWADIFREWKENLLLGDPPANSNGLRLLRKVIADEARQGGD